MARQIISLSNLKNNFKYVYEESDDIKTKIYKVCTKIYGAKNVLYLNSSEEKILSLEKEGYKSFPICIAKTQYSLSDDPKNLNGEGEYDIHIRDVVLKKGAEFILLLTGDIMTMPGLSKRPNAEKIDLVDNEIRGIF